MIKLNLGSGYYKLQGWINVDLDARSRPDVVADLAKGLPFADLTADFMHTEDFIDQLSLPDAMTFLVECHRILKPGGVIRVLTPDVEKLAQLYLEQPDRLLWLWRDAVSTPLVLGTAAEVFNLGMRIAGHTFLYDAETFSGMAEACGFRVQRTTYQQSSYEDLRGLDLRDPDHAISLYCDCVKLH